MVKKLFNTLMKKVYSVLKAVGLQRDHLPAYSVRFELDLLY